MTGLRDVGEGDKSAATGFRFGLARFGFNPQILVSHVILDYN